MYFSGRFIQVLLYIAKQGPNTKHPHSLRAATDNGPTTTAKTPIGTYSRRVWHREEETKINIRDTTVTTTTVKTTPRIIQQRSMAPRGRDKDQ